MDNQKQTGMRKGLSVSLVLILIFLALVPAGSARTSAVQDNSAEAWRLPFIRVGHSAVYDSWNDRILVFGGWNGQQFFNDVWALDVTAGAEAWTKLNPSNAWPGARGQHTAIFDHATRRMIVYGGHGSHYNYDDVWALDVLTGGAESWTQLQPSGPAIGARRFHSAINDGLNGRMIVFGGSRGGALLNDVWALDLTPGAEAWSQLAVTGSVPTARGQHTAIYDEENNLMVVFGGAAAGGLLNDTWALNLGTLQWTQMAPQGTPPPARRGHTAVMNSAQDKMVVFGGLGSGGFLNDLWKLELTPGAVEWVQLDPNGGPPGTRAWHAATYKMQNINVFVLGGWGMGSLSGQAQWKLDLGTMTWSPLTPSLPGWWAGGLAAQSVQSDGIPEVTLNIEDAAPGTLAYLLLSSEVWFVVQLKTADAAYANDVDVTLDVVASKFDVTQVGTRHRDADEVGGWTTPTSLGSGRYRLDNVDLTKESGDSKYQTQVVFKATPKAESGGTPITAVAEGSGWTAALESPATARIQRDPQAWIITNRAKLFAEYDNSEVRDLLDEIYEVAANRSAVVFYLDRYVPDLETWDNTAVDYTSETTANEVAHQVAEWLATRIVSWDPYPTFAYPTYLAIVGDDDIIPFYRKHDYGADGDTGDKSEDDESNCWGDDGVCDQVVSHNFFLTDNPYGDQEYGTFYADWESGGMEAAAGRIVGATPADMQRFLENAALGPNPNVQRAILASDGVDWWLSGPDNDAHNVLKYDLGYTLNETLIDSDADKAEIVAEMQKGFAVMGAAHHGETYVWQVPACGTFPTCHLVSDEIPDYGPGGQIPANRPFFYFNACRVGMSYTDGWGWGEPGVYDDSMVYALVNEGASGIIASAGLAYGSFTNNAAANSEVLANNFWVESRAAPDRSDPLGWSLMRAKNKHPVNDNITEKKTVQTFTYFGLPWTRLPGHGSSQAAQAGVPSTPWSAPTRGPATGPAAIDVTYVITAAVDASVYAISTTVEGFDLIDVQGLSQRIQDGQVVLPEATLEVILPLSATVTSLVFTPTQAVALPGLDIPTFLAGVSIPGGPTGGYTNTVDGLYPVTASFESRMLDTYQLVRVNVVPVTYDATNDQATLYRNVDLAVEYDTPETIALTFFEPDKLQYLPGETISTTASLVNAGDVAETVTATLILQDAQSQIVGFQGAGAFDVPAGGTYELEMGWTGPLDGDVYLARLFIWRGGQVVAGAGSTVLVADGEVSEVSVPELLMPGEEATFALTFDNLGASNTIALASLAIYDQDDVLVAFLPIQAAAVAGGGSATLTAAWAPEQPGSYTASFMLTAGGQEYGPLSQTFDVAQRIYLPLVMRNY